MVEDHRVRSVLCMPVSGCSDASSYWPATAPWTYHFPHVLRQHTPAQHLHALGDGCCAFAGPVTVPLAATFFNRSSLLPQVPQLLPCPHRARRCLTKLGARRALKPSTDIAALCMCSITCLMACRHLLQQELLPASGIRILGLTLTLLPAAAPAAVPRHHRAPLWPCGPCLCRRPARCHSAPEAPHRRGHPACRHALHALPRPAHSLSLHGHPACRRLLHALPRPADCLCLCKRSAHRQAPRRPGAPAGRLALCARPHHLLLLLLPCRGRLLGQWPAPTSALRPFRAPDGLHRCARPARGLRCPQTVQRPGGDWGGRHAVPPIQPCS